MPGARGSGRSASKDGVSMVISLDMIMALFLIPKVGNYVTRKIGTGELNKIMEQNVRLSVSTSAIYSYHGVAVRIASVIASPTIAMLA